MAELGHPVLGPQSYWKLTPGEIRVYAEGMHVESQRRKNDAAYSQSSSAASGPTYDRASKKRRDEAALKRMDQKVEAQRG